MDDLIRREDAQRITGELLSGWLTDGEREILEKVEAELGELPSAQQWIPCSERLPKDEQEILFSSRFGRIHIGKYNDDSSLNRWFSYRDKIRFMNDEVTAWMPLPDLYKEEQT